MEQFKTWGLRDALAKTPPGYTMDFTDGKTGEEWTALRKDDYEDLLARLERCSGKVRHDKTHSTAQGPVTHGELE